MAEKHGNRWRVKVRREDGTRGYKSFETKADADSYGKVASQYDVVRVPMDDKMRQRIMKMQRSAVTLAHYALPLIQDPNLRQSSRDVYGKALGKVEGTDLGNTPIARVTPAQVREFVNGLKVERRNVTQFLGKLFNSAVEEGLITVSPLKRAKVKRPSVAQKDIEPLSVAEVERLVEAAREGSADPRSGSEQDALCIRLGAFTGLRGGEVAGLRVQDIDVAACTIHVRRNVTTTSAGRQVGEPKTKASTRKITVACSLVEALAEWIEANPPGPDGFIFRTSHGNRISSYTLSRATQRAAERAGLRPVSFHDLRHACASMLIHAGADVKTLQHYFGHASARITLDVYGHLMPQSDAALASAMEAMMEANRNGGAS
jgi:integrase